MLRPLRVSSQSNDDNTLRAESQSGNNNGNDGVNYFILSPLAFFRIAAATN
jgi:hypothetical protein